MLRRKQRATDGTKPTTRLAIHISTLIVSRKHLVWSFTFCSRECLLPRRALWPLGRQGLVQRSFNGGMGRGLL